MIFTHQNIISKFSKKPIFIENDNDFKITFNKNCYTVFSDMVIQNVNLIDQSGRIILTGLKITDFSFKIKLKINLNRYIAAFILIKTVEGKYIKNIFRYNENLASKV